jgi:hypothetical protein
MLTFFKIQIAAAFNRRMLVDACKPIIQFTATQGKISGFTVSSNSNFCEVPIPVTVAKHLSDTKGFVTEQLGSDPMTLWVKLDGEAISFEFS